MTNEIANQLAEAFAKRFTAHVDTEEDDISLILAIGPEDVDASLVEMMP